MEERKNAFRTVRPQPSTTRKPMSATVFRFTKAGVDEHADGQSLLAKNHETTTYPQVLYHNPTQAPYNSQEKAIRARRPITDKHAKTARYRVKIAEELISVYGKLSLCTREIDI